MDQVTIVIQPEVTRTIEMGFQGPAGPPGTGDKTYVHDQQVPASSWTVNHNLNKHPSVDVVDSADSEVQGNVQHITVNQLTISFNAAFAGKAYLN
jgi:hypothetical protein